MLVAQFFGALVDVDVAQRATGSCFSAHLYCVQFLSDVFATDFVELNVPQFDDAVPSPTEQHPLVPEQFGEPQAAYSPFMRLFSRDHELTTNIETDIPILAPSDYVGLNVTSEHTRSVCDR